MRAYYVVASGGRPRAPRAAGVIGRARRPRSSVEAGVIIGRARAANRRETPEAWSDAMQA